MHTKYIINNVTQIQCIVTDELLAGNRLMDFLKECPHYSWRNDDVLTAQCTRPIEYYTLVDGEWIEDCDLLARRLGKSAIEF
jgi:hypothetical protein